MEKRNLYLTNISPEDALEQFINAFKPDIGIESVHTCEALGRITAGAIYAKCSSPLYDSAAMDGVAVISAHTHGASENAPIDLKIGVDYISVDTGDPVRPPYDAVIMAEYCQETGSESVRIRAAAFPWQNVRPVGEDIAQGEMILQGNSQIRPMDIGVLLSGGITSVEVYKKASVAILPTGTELVEPGSNFREGDIIESNSYMLAGLVSQNGIPNRLPPIPDNYAVLKNLIANAAANHDMTLIIAGSSAGTEDYTVHALRELGNVIVHGVAVKPGKPVILAVVNGKPVIGIPGYPVSAYIAYMNFAAPVMAMLSKCPPAETLTCKAILTRRLVSSLKYKEYVRVKVGRVGDRLIAAPLARGAGAAMSLVRSDGFCVIEQNLEGIEAGSEVNILLNRPLARLERTIVSIGSHDLLLDVMADMLSRQCLGVYLSSTHVGSMAGLLALNSSCAHITPCHLLDEMTGEYNKSFIQKVFKETPISLIKGVGRIQGFIVNKGNPLRLKCVSDLPGCRYVNRQRGAGTRVLLDYLLKKEGLKPDDIQNYDREAATHMAVAAAVKNGSADTGMGVLSAARAMDLDFVPLYDEEYDFAVPTKFLELEEIKAFITVLKSDELREILLELGGYTFERTGEVIHIE